MIQLFAGWLGLERKMVRASTLDVGGGQSERLIGLCERFEANRYLSGNAAKDYLAVELFAKEGIEIVWQDYQHPVYPQQHGEFVPYLSIVDLILNCGEDSRRILEESK